MVYILLVVPYPHLHRGQNEPTLCALKTGVRALKNYASVKFVPRFPYFCSLPITAGAGGSTNSTTAPAPSTRAPICSAEKCPVLKTLFATLAFDKLSRFYCEGGLVLGLEG